MHPPDRSERRASVPSASNALIFAAVAVILIALRPHGRRAMAGAGDTAPATQVAQEARGAPTVGAAVERQGGWKGFIRRLIKEFSGDRVLANAGSVTYFALLALFPAITSLVSLYGLYADIGTVDKHMALLNGIVPGGGMQIIEEQLKRVALKGPQALGLGFVLGLGMALWSANGGMKSLFDTLNIVHGQPERRGFLKLNAVTLAFTIGAILFLLLSMAGIVVVPVLLGYVGLGDETTAWLVGVLRWPLLLVGVLLGLALLYRFGPNRDRPRWRWITWGSAVAAVLWVGGSMLFSWYAANFGSYDQTYGSLGAVIGFMTWLWISSIVVLVGAEIDAELERAEGTPDAR
jgi:membrane protein